MEGELCRISPDDRLEAHNAGAQVPAHMTTEPISERGRRYI